MAGEPRDIPSKRLWSSACLSRVRSVCPPIATTPGAGNMQTYIEEKNEHENPYSEFPEPFAERRNGPGTRGISVDHCASGFRSYRRYDYPRQRPEQRVHEDRQHSGRIYFVVANIHTPLLCNRFKRACGC